MSKSAGRKIAIKFTDKILGDIALLRHLPIGAVGTPMTPKAYVTQSSYYSSVAYDGYKTLDGKTDTMWYARTSPPHWILYRLLRPIYVTSFRLHLSSSYRPKDTVIEGSQDGLTWNVLGTFSIPSSGSGWIELFLTQNMDSYMQYRITFTTTHSTYVYLNEVEFVEKTDYALSITGNEPLTTGSPIIPVRYHISSIEEHPTEPWTLLITFNQYSAFNNIEGQLRLVYDSTKGNMIGRGGPVASFDVLFSPVELVKQVPYEHEHRIVVTSQSAAILTPVTYHNGYSEQGTITVAIQNASVTLTPIVIENP